jgi:hypothetical protein
MSGIVELEARNRPFSVRRELLLGAFTTITPILLSLNPERVSARAF